MKTDHIIWIAGLFIPALLLYGCSGNAPGHDSFSADNTLWYDTPAVQWEETLPAGNGRLGIMPDGGIGEELIVLNEISMWSGSEYDYSNPETAKSLPSIREMLKKGKNKEAQDLLFSSFLPCWPASGGTYGCYQTLGDLHISYPRHREISGYRRWLDLEKGIIHTSYTADGICFTREYYVPKGADVAIVHIKADRNDAINFSTSISRSERGTSEATEDCRLRLAGELDSGVKGKPGVKYLAIAGIKTSGKNASKSSDGKTVTVRDADEAWIILSAATSYLAGEKYGEEAEKLLTSALEANPGRIKAEAVDAYRELYDRASLHIAGNNGISGMPTDKRIRLFQEQDDPSLAALYYNYGRYLLISSTRPGSLPPNLQGLWCNTTVTPWTGDYHTNINVQMNHWPVEQGNLSELHLPLTDLIERLVPDGRRSAKAFYGSEAEGWVQHMMTNIWGYTAPGEHPEWGATNTGGAWLCAHLWQHYLYTGDIGYLERVYPIMKGSAEFFYSTMIREPEHGWLVTAPSSSPENSFYPDPDAKEAVSICMGPTIDTQIIHELYTNVITASRLLGCDAVFSEKLEAALKELPPMQISKEGYLMEWLKDYREAEIHHRHVSHLYGLHPGNLISVSGTPELAEACRKTLDRRGDEATGWSRAWKINFWARLGDGDRAYKLFKSLLKPAYSLEEPMKHDSGTFPNLFCSHAPFQIDGNFGGTSGISEMLIQSQDGFISLLPALPSTWKEGELHGFKVRGGAAIDLVWKDGKAKNAVITGGWHPDIRIKIPDNVETVSIGGKSYTGGSIADLDLRQGEKIRICFS